MDVCRVGLITRQSPVMSQLNDYINRIINTPFQCYQMMIVVVVSFLVISLIIRVSLSSLIRIDTTHNIITPPQFHDPLVARVIIYIH